MLCIAQELEQVAYDVMNQLEACLSHPTHGAVATDALGHLADVLVDLTSLEANGYASNSRDAQRVYVYLLHREVVALGFCGDTQVRIYAAQAAMGVMQLTARLRELQPPSLPLRYDNAMAMAQGAL